MTQYWPFSGLIRHGPLRERLIVSLDFAGQQQALELVDELARVVGMFKVGKALFSAGGPELVREIRRRGGEVFLDLRFHEGRRGLLRAALEATRLGVRMFDLSANVHPEPIAQLRREIARLCEKEGLRKPVLIALAMLAQVRRTLPDKGPDTAAADGVIELAKRASATGLDGVFTSLKEVKSVRNACGRRFVIVTSGVNVPDAAAEAGGQRGASDAIRAGADYLVIGSPIWRSTDPVSAIREIVDRIEHELRSAPLGPRELFLTRQF